MKKISILLCISIISFHANTTFAMMEKFNKIVGSIYPKYFKHNEPAPYTFYAPRESYSYFSPHFNMYHYVGMDYASSNDATIEMIQRDLATGIRGFKFKITTATPSSMMIFVGKDDNKIELSTVLKKIATFAEKNNEIVIVHITGAMKHETIITEDIRGRTDFNKLIFTPSDRLKDIENNAAKKRITTTASRENLTVWPRLKWNYANKKLVMITWDSPKHSDYCWDYNTYFTNNLTESKKLIETDVDSISASIPVTTIGKLAIFYSDVLKAELITGLGTITALCALMIYNYLTVPRTYTHTDLVYPPTVNGWQYYNNIDTLPKEDSTVFLKAYQRAADTYSSSPTERDNIWAMTSVTQEQIKALVGPGEPEVSYPARKVFFSSLTQYLNTPYKGTIVTTSSWYDKVTGGFFASIGTSLTALGVYSIGLTKNAFTIVKAEKIPASQSMPITGFFLKQPLTNTNITTITENKSVVFNTVSQLNRENYTVINKFERSLLMQVAHHGRRITSSITNRIRKK